MYTTPISREDAENMIRVNVERIRRALQGIPMPAVPAEEIDHEGELFPGEAETLRMQFGAMRRALVHIGAEYLVSSLEIPESLQNNLPLLRGMLNETYLVLKDAVFSWFNLLMAAEGTNVPPRKTQEYVSRATREMQKIVRTP